MTILSQPDFAEIRAALDTSLTPFDLPDATIALPLFLDGADRAVKAEAPDWATYTGDDAAALRAAAIYWTAALLAPMVPNFSSEVVGRNEHRYDATNPGALDLGRILLQRAWRELRSIPGVALLPHPTLFTLALGGRGQRRRLGPLPRGYGATYAVLGLPE